MKKTCQEKDIELKKIEVCEGLVHAPCSVSGKP
jgi:hypothetical protein